MTRTDDRFVPLAARTEFANRVMADLFISIHCNASINAKANGFEVYFLSDKATDRASAAVASMENSVIALEDPNSCAKQNNIEFLLLSMAVSEFMNESSMFCGYISKIVSEDMSSMIKNRGVKQANFHVLRGASMPAVLVELGYLSNSKDERTLGQPRFQKKISETLAKSIKLYEKRMAR
ncbi:MAG: N-acetylmuramoyl-L-alanine amidase [Kiritimatiellae bacterium]|nr:N-acetylmuramoyl-L-alanine amidase [Kiritimatiellia bacterium]